MSQPLTVLGIDEDRDHALAIAQAMNQGGVSYRFVTDRQKTLAGIKQLSPNLLLIHGQVRSELASSVLEMLSTDVTCANLPIILVSDDIGDHTLCRGLRTGIVAVLPKPFSAATHPQAFIEIHNSLELRRGEISGVGDSFAVSQLVEFLRRTKRSGLLTLKRQEGTESRAAFIAGKLRDAQHESLAGVEALVSMVTLPKVGWHFQELAQGPTATQGVVISVGEEAPVMGQLLPGEAPDAEASTQAPPNILLVDDDKSLCTMFSQLFAKRGYQVTTAVDGLDGFEKAVAGDFNIVIADLNMPRLDGWGMLRLLREDFRTRELPLAFMSCHDDYRESLKAVDAGAQSFLSKGTRLDSLLTEVKKVLEPRETTRSLIQAQNDFSLFIAPVGAQWLLKTLSELRLTATVLAKDNWAEYTISMLDGRPFHAMAQSGKHSALAEKAFNAFIASKNPEAEIKFTRPTAHENLSQSLDVLIERACHTLNENDRRMRAALIDSASGIELNKDLYNIYRQIAPKTWVDAARLLCEENVPPRELASKVTMEATEIDEMIRDLLRRDVITLTK